MTACERFLECLAFGQPDRTFCRETLRYWRDTMRAG